MAAMASVWSKTVVWRKRQGWKMLMAAMASVWSKTVDPTNTHSTVALFKPRNSLKANTQKWNAWWFCFAAQEDKEARDKEREERKAKIKEGQKKAKDKRKSKEGSGGAGAVRAEPATGTVL
jgi:hypothetical protein